MAECTQYSSLVVEDTLYTVQYGLNGTYVPNGTSVLEGETYTIFLKQGAVNYPRIWVNPSFFPPEWRLDGAAPYPGFNFGTGLISTFGDCPVGEWSENIIITGVQTPSPNNTFGLPADVVALITSRFGTVANFLRLRNQGQV